LDDKEIIATTQNGEILDIQNKDLKQCQFSLPAENGSYIVAMTDKMSGKIYDEVKFCVVNNFSFSFDRDYYLESAEDGIATIDIGEEHYELPLADKGSKAKIAYNDGEIQVDIPRIRFLLDGKPLPKNAVWKNIISPQSILRVFCPKTLDLFLLFANSPMERYKNLGVYDYTIGNSVQAYDGDSKLVPIKLCVANDTIRLFDIIFKMSLTEKPSFNLTGNTLTWLNSHAFMGDTTTPLKFEFQSKYGQPITMSAKQGQKLLSEDFPSESKHYHFKVAALNDSAFGIMETLLAEDDIIFGDRAAVIFDNKILRINEVIYNGKNITIKPVFADKITYVGNENLGFTDLSGNYGHYTANLFFNTMNGKVYFRDLNPVDIYLVNETAGRLHISFDEGEGLFIDMTKCIPELFKHVNLPTNIARYLKIPDFFIFNSCQEKQ
jgi:hypothetical protein